MTLERIKAGDAAALEELLQDAWDPLVRHLASVAGSPHAGEDLAQEAFVRLWERRESWSAGSARALVFRIGRNLALDHRRRGDVRARHGVAVEPDVAPPPDEDLDRARVRMRVSDAVDGLAPRRREAFELVRFAGLTHEEAAEALGLSPQTVANHVGLALRDLRAKLADLVAEEPSSGEAEGRRRDG